VSAARDVGGEPLCAAIDLGTNTFLLLIGRAVGRELQVVEDRCRTPRLGAGLASRGRLSDEAMARGVEVLAEFAERLREAGIDSTRVRAVGTAALRRAANAAEFIALARARTGVAIAVIAEDEEARLGYAAAVGEGAPAGTVVVDVGGGSTEVVAGGGTARASAPIGAVVLTERWQRDLEGRAWSDAEWSAMAREIEAACSTFPAGAVSRAAAPLTVLGGTAANLACVESQLERFDPHAVEGWKLAARSAAEWAERLRRLDLARRLELPIEAERAAILPAGLACLAGVLARLGADEIRVTGRGLRYALLRELYAGARRA
jgi:exopolyphosphatase/guanosine-5'-triphosphate,3'-diphosphate pyrophosphatase